MRSRSLGLAATLAVLAGLGSTAQAAGRAGEQGKVRIGVYDNRAVAVACAMAGMGPVKAMKAKMAEYEAAKKAGNTTRANELETWGKNQQRLMHFQGFGHVPVGDLLEPIKAQLAQLARVKGLAAIAMECDFTGPNVEVVDVTDAIVELYKPTDRTRKVVAEMKAVKPLSLLELADMPAEK